MDINERKNKLRNDFVLFVLVGVVLGSVCVIVSALGGVIVAVLYGLFGLINKRGDIRHIGKLKASDQFDWALMVFRALSVVIGLVLGGFATSSIF